MVIICVVIPVVTAVSDIGHLIHNVGHSTPPGSERPNIGFS